MPDYQITVDYREIPNGTVFTKKMDANFPDGYYYNEDINTWIAADVVESNAELDDSTIPDQSTMSANYASYQASKKGSGTIIIDGKEQPAQEITEIPGMAINFDSQKVFLEV
jgi:hypothetical protein